MRNIKRILSLSTIIILTLCLLSSCQTNNVVNSDPTIDRLNEFAAMVKAEKNISLGYPDITVYRHVDAALFGGFLPFTEHKDMVSRKVHQFDSIALSGHKFFGMDEPAGLFLTTKEIKDNQNPYNVTYLNGSMPMINCSRSAIASLKFWWLIKHVGIEGFTEEANKIFDATKYLKDGLDKIGWQSWLEPMSNTVYFKRPPKEITEKYMLAPDFDERLGGELSHIIVMQHVTKETIQRFLDDLGKYAEGNK